MSLALIFQKMYKIDKLIKVTKKFPVLSVRHRSSKDDGCCKVCPPTYECVQPVEVDEFEVERYRKEYVHPFLRNESPKDSRPWRNIFLFICLPTIIALLIDHLLLHPKKVKRPKFIAYSHLRIRRKEFPWDPVRTLFHNPRVNALPDGYEMEVPEDEEVEL